MGASLDFEVEVGGVEKKHDGMKNICEEVAFL